MYVPPVGSEGLASPSPMDSPKKGNGWSFAASLTPPLSAQAADARIATEIYPQHSLIVGSETYINSGIQHSLKEIPEAEYSMTTHKTDSLRSSMNQLVPVDEKPGVDEEDLFGGEFDIGSETEEIEKEETKALTEVSKGTTTKVEGATVEIKKSKETAVVKEETAVVEVATKFVSQELAEKMGEVSKTIDKGLATIDKFDNPSLIHDELKKRIGKLAENHTEKDLKNIVQDLLREYHGSGLLLRNGVRISDDEFEKLLQEILKNVSSFYREEILPLLNQKKESEEPVKRRESTVPQGKYNLQQQSMEPASRKATDSSRSGSTDLQLTEIKSMAEKDTDKRTRENKQAEKDLEKGDEIRRTDIKKRKDKEDVQSSEIKGNQSKESHANKRTQKAQIDKGLKEKIKLSSDPDVPPVDIIDYSKQKPPS